MIVEYSVSLIPTVCQGLFTEYNDHSKETQTSLNQLFHVIFYVTLSNNLNKMDYTYVESLIKCYYEVA